MRVTTHARRLIGQLTPSGSAETFGIPIRQDRRSSNGYVSGTNGNKVLWVRPRGTNLKVAGRRLDGDDAEELRVDIPCCYPTGFQASRVYFPTSGCWEVTAMAGDSELRFVTKIP